MSEKETIELTLEEKKEEQLKEYIEFFNKQHFFSSFTKQVIQDIANNKKESIVFRKYSREDIISALENPQSNEKKLRDMSIFLYANSTHYRRLCNYFSKLCTYNYTIIPYNINPAKYNKKSFLINYLKVATLLDKFNFKNHLLKILNICMYQDTYFGLWFESPDSFDITQINPDYCKISSREDSCLKFSLNFDFFKTRLYLLESYGEKIKQMYIDYAGELNSSNGKKKKGTGNPKLQWQEPPNQICFKVNEDQLYYSLPPFSGIFPEILNLEEYKLLKKSGEILNIYKLLVMKLPLNDDGGFKIDLKLAEKFYEKACKSVDTGVGLIFSPLEIDSVDFQRNASSDVNAVNDAESSLWSAGGTNGSLFGQGDKLSSSSMNLSIKNDESIAFSMLRQVECWINLYIKNLNLPYDFKVSYLDQSIYNINEVCDKYQKAATYGVGGTKTLYQASLGISPSDALGFEVLESVLDYDSKWTPLQSSSTQSNDESGRPTNKEKGKGLDDSGEKTENGDGNDR